MNDFVEERLVKQTKDCYSPIRKYKLQLFDSLNKPMVIAEAKKRKTLKTEPDLFQRLIVVAQMRKIDLKNILSQELTAVPLSIARPDGTMNKSVKSQLLKELETVQKGQKEAPLATEQNVAYILDGMAVLHMLRDIPKTFGVLAATFFEKASASFAQPNVSRVDVVFDIYSNENDSIKAFEHSDRQIEVGYEIRILNVPQGQAYRYYLANSKNEMHLTWFLGGKMVEIAKQNIVQGNVMYCT